jgi:uncharacterized integral membrane protein
MATLRIILILVAFVVLLVIAIYNYGNEATNVWLGQPLGSQPLSIVMLYSFAFGGLCVGIFTVISEIRLRTRLRRQKKEIDALMDELRALRNAPLEADPSQKAAPPGTDVDHEIEED